MVQGGQELRQHGSGTLIPSLGGSIKTTKPVCRNLQSTNLQLPTTELQDSKDYRNYKLQNSKLQTCQLTNLQTFSSQPGGPQGAGGFFPSSVPWYHGITTPYASWLSGFWRELSQPSDYLRLLSPHPQPGECRLSLATLGTWA